MCRKSVDERFFNINKVLKLFKNLLIDITLRNEKEFLISYFFLYFL